MTKILTGCALVVLAFSTGFCSEDAAKDEGSKIAELAKNYPLKTCVVTGAELGSMGDPVNLLHEGRLVRFCCKGCINKFKADPAKYFKVIDDSAAGKPAEKAAGAGCGHGKDAAKKGCGGCGGGAAAKAEETGAKKEEVKKGGCGSGCGGCGSR